ncbi:MAG: SMC family ATPase [Thermoplasmata archaeon]|nr:MAG: SMC family ATPase [Thermoplasmata archaeon]
MRLISLTLHNFRKFKDAEINFPDGIIGFVGNNGTGKSTIIEAIGWAIYGNKASRTPKEQIKRQGAGKHEDCWVRLQFEMGGNHYEVIRIIGKNLSTDARVKVNGLISASSTNAVTSFLEKRIGMDYDSFYTSIVAKQKELNALSDKSPAERKKSMLKMLKIDLLEDAIRRVREDRRTKENMLDWIEKNLKDLDELEKEKKKMRERLEELSLKKEHLAGEIKRIEDELEEIEKERAEERKRAEVFKNLESKKKLLEERIVMKRRMKEEKIREKEELIKKKEEYEEIKHFSNEYDELCARKEDLEKLREKYHEKKKLEEEEKRLRKEIENIDKEIKRNEKEVEDEQRTRKEFEDIEKKIKDIEDTKRELERERQEKQAEKKEIMKRKQETEEKLIEIKKIGPDSDCPTCGRPLREKYDELVKRFEKDIEGYKIRIGEIDRDIERIERELMERGEEIKSYEKMKAEIEEKLRRFSVIRERIRIFVKQKEDKESIWKEKQENIAKLGVIEFNEEEYAEIDGRIKYLMPIKNKIAVLENEIKKLPYMEEEIRKIENEEKEIILELNKCNEEIKNLAFDEEKYREIERKYEEVKERTYKKREEMVKIEGDIEYTKKDIEKMEKEIEEQRRQREKIKVLRREIANLEMLAGDRDTGLLNNFKKYLISKIGPLLSYYASHFFSMFTQGKYKEIEIDENYSIYIYDGGEKFDIGRFSGGENDLANLSLRLAISQLISQRSDISLNFIALDEIFGSQDRERRKNVLNALAELKNQFKQILLITHIEDIKDSLEHIIKVYEDEEGISHIQIE